LRGGAGAYRCDERLLLACTQVSVALLFCSGMPLCAVVVLLVSIIMITQHMWSACTQVSVALLFCSGMPLCAGVVVLVFAITNLVDRWALISLMTVTRYSAQLPDLILGNDVGKHACRVGAV
jgi:hypothetical protein